MSNEAELKALAQATHDGKEAERLLASPILMKWFMVRKAELFESFGLTKADDDEPRKLIWLKKQVVDELEQDLRNYIESGNLATTTLKEWDNLKGDK